jgi:opacity protein-like surface antigen
MLLAVPLLAQDKIGSLLISTLPDNATVMIDDELVGTTPLTLSNIKAGKHRLVIKKEGCMTVERVIEVTADEIKKVEVLLTQIEKRPETPSQPPTPVPTPTGVPLVTPKESLSLAPTEYSLTIRKSVSYSFSDSEIESCYDNMSSFGLDLVMDTANPIFSWMVSLDLVQGSYEEEEEDEDGYFTYKSELSLTGLSGAAVWHSPRTQQFQVYGGAGLGYYSAIAKWSESFTWGTFSDSDSDSDSDNGKGVGFKLLGGAAVAFSPAVSLGLSATFLKLDVAFGGGGTSVDLGATIIDLGLNIRF